VEIGPYTIEGELAQGGQGVVYRAVDTRLNRPVVIKLLQLEGEAQARRMQREAKAMAQLRHPHLVALHDFGEHDGKPYLVLPYLPAPSLQRRLDQRGPLQLEHALRFTAEVGQALAVAHAAGLVHRDVKPANVLVDEQGRALLTDFGLVKQVGPGQSLTLTLSVEGQFLGTPGYWPPEQAQGRHDEVGPAADVYALGGLLYALLTGKPPREVPNLQAVYQAFRQPPQPISTFREDLPAWVERLVGACLELEPARRPSLARVLEACETQSFRGALRPRSGAWRYVAGVGGALSLSLGLTLWLVSGGGAQGPSTEASPVDSPGAAPPPPAGAEGSSSRAVGGWRCWWARLRTEWDELDPTLRGSLEDERDRLQRSLGRELTDAMLAREASAQELRELSENMSEIARALDEGDGLLLIGRSLFATSAETRDPRVYRLAQAALVRAYRLGQDSALYTLANLVHYDPELTDVERWGVRQALLERAAERGSVGAIANLASRAYLLGRGPSGLEVADPAQLERLRDLLARLDDRYAVGTRFAELTSAQGVQLASAVAFEALSAPSGSPNGMQHLARAYGQLHDVYRAVVRERVEPMILDDARVLLAELERRLGLAPSDAGDRGLATARARLAELLEELEEDSPAELQQEAAELVERVAEELVDAVLAAEPAGADLETIRSHEALTRFGQLGEAECLVIAGKTYMRSDAEGEAKAEANRMARLCFVEAVKLGSVDALYRLAEASGRTPGLSRAELILVKMELEDRAARKGSSQALADLASRLYGIARNQPARREWAEARLVETLALLDDRFHLDVLGLDGDSKLELACAVAYEATHDPPEDSLEDLQALERARTQIVELTEAGVRVQFEPRTRQLATSQLAALERRITEVRERLGR